MKRLFKYKGEIILVVGLILCALGAIVITKSPIRDVILIIGMGGSLIGAGMLGESVRSEQNGR